MLHEIDRYITILKNAYGRPKILDILCPTGNLITSHSDAVPVAVWSQQVIIQNYELFAINCVDVLEG